MYFLIASFVFLAGIAAICTAIFPGNDKASAICLNLVSHGLDPGVCRGALKLPDHYVHGTGWVANSIFRNVYLFTYGSAMVLSLLPFLFMESVNISKKYVLAFPVAAFTFMLPLYVFAIDWGRWIHIFIFFLSTLVFSLTTLGYFKPRMKMPVILITAYALLWSVPHCCHTGLGVGAGGYVNEIFSRMFRMFM